MSDPPKSLTGSCLCKSFQYTLSLTPSQLTSLTAIRCNCTFCQKRGFTGLTVPSNTFTLLSPSSKSNLGTYNVPSSPSIHRYFCKSCGCQAFQEGFYEHEGQKFEIFYVSLGTVDQPQEGLKLNDVKIVYAGMKSLENVGVLRDVPWEGGYR